MYNLMLGNKFAIILLIIFLSIKVQGQVSGTVFSDYNANGTKENTSAYNEPFVSGTTVTATLPNGTSFTTTTNSSGAYSFTSTQIPSGTKVRIEFSDPVSSSFNGSSNGTNVQFTIGGTNNVNYAISSPDDYWDNTNNPDPTLMVVHHQRGTLTNIATHQNRALLQVNYSSSGPNNPTSSTQMSIDTSLRPALHSEVGSTFALAYHAKQERFFQAAFMKRMEAFGPKGTGGLYVMTKTGNTWDLTSSFSLQGVTPNNSATALDFGSVTRTTTPGTTSTQANYISINGQWSLSTGSDGRDNDAFFKVGTISIGGVDIDRCSDILYLINMSQKRLVTIDISGSSTSLNNASAATLGTLTKAYDLASLPGYPSAVGTGNNIRPFAVKIYRNKGYIGVVSDAMATQNISHLKGYILQFDPTNIAAGFTNILTINFDQYAFADFWHPWISTWAQCGGTNSSGPVAYPQPMISDLEFNEDGSLDIGIRDRWGDQNASFEFWPVPTPSTIAAHTQSVTLGDVLHVCNVNGTWAIEGTSGSCTQNFTNGNETVNNVGYGSSYGSTSKEFYSDRAGDGNTEDSFGGLAKIMGKKQTVVTCLDPFGQDQTPSSNYWSTSGVLWLNNVTGAKDQILRCLGGDFNNLDKVNSLGDLEFVQPCPKIQIGNRLWVDTDEDGVQDANENPISGVTVELTAPGTDGVLGTSDDIVVASTTTDSNGNYYFSSLTTSDTRKPSLWTGIGNNDILPTYNYQVRIPLNQTTITSNNYIITTADINSNSNDNIDNDGIAKTIGTINYSATNFNTSTTNHNFDFGFKVACTLTASATGTNVTCNGGTNGSASVTASGNIAPVTYLWSNGATAQSISNLTAGTYTVTITETPTCKTTASYTVTEPNTLNVACAKTDVTTNGGNDGTANVTATGGTSPYTYNWSNGATTQSISNLTAGTYSVTVNDANSCSSTCSTTVNEPACNLNATATGTNVTCNGGTNGSASVTATGNIAPVTYLWSNGATTQSISNLTAGTYTVTVTETPTCITTASYTVTEPSALNVACTKTDVTTNGGNDGTASVTASGGTSPYTYKWSNGATTQSISNLTAGTYSVTVSDANSCSSTCSTTVNEPACNLNATATGTNVTCNGGTNGSATVTATGNIAPVTYLWSNGATTQSVSNLTAGTYTVTVTETPTCITTASYTVTEPTALSIVCAKTDVTTNGGNDGTASVTANGGTSPYTYIWSNGGTTSNISNLTAGTYSVTVSDANNCTSTCSTTVNEPGCNLTATTTGTNVTCNGGTNGSASVTASGNIAPVTYLWSNGATTQSISNLTAGTYTVTITETPTCKITASYTVTEPNTLNVSCAKTDVTTNGGNDGTASVTATGGTSPYTYNWSNGATTQSISNLTAGIYTVTVSDANNCTSTCSTTVNEPACNLSAIATGTNITCNGGTNGSASVTASGNIAAVTYLWSNGATTQSISNLTAGTYTVTVTETPTCITTASYTVTEPSTLNVSCVKTDVTTNGGNDGTASVTANGGTSPYTYIWSNGATTQSISNLTAGTYTVTVSDANNCTSTCTTTVNEPGCNLTATTTGTNVTCNGGTNGSASVTASGNIASVTYLWSNGATTQSISNLTAGTYTVTVTETPTCKTTASYTVTEPSALNVACAKTDVTTSGGNDGTASVTASGGTSPYTYNWSNGATTSSISNLTAGTYSVTVSDANSCSSTCSTTVNEPGCALTATATGTNVTCNGGTNGSTSVTASGNIAPVTYLWSNGATTQSISNLTAGTYTVTVTETPTCITTASYTVTEPSALNVVCAKTDVTISGGNDGTASVTATGGTSPYTYNWSNGATTSSISNLTAGTYTVTVSDANNCTSTCSTTVNEPGCNLSATTTGTNVTCNGGTNGTASVTATGNIALVTYLWSNGATTQSISNLTTGTYTITVTETPTCITTASYTVSEPSALNVACAKTDVTTSGGNDGTASVTVTGGTSLYTYLWSNGATTQSISNLTAGTYTVTVSDANNCTSTCSTTVNEPGCALTATATGTNVTCNGGTNGIANVTASGNIAPVTYLWSNGATTQSISNLTAGTYTVTVTETATCKTTANYTVSEPTALSVACAKTDVTTSGGNDGTASVTATGGTSPYTYNWSNGATTSSISNLTAGTYSVTVSDANNCIATCSTIVGSPAGCVKPNAGNDQTLTCINNIVPTTASLGAAPTGTSWSIITQPVTANAVLNSNSGEVSAMSATGRYIFLLTNTSDSQCKDTVVVTIKNCVDYPLCGTDEYVISADGGLNNYQWYQDSGSGFQLLSGQTASTLTVTTVGSYYWTAKDNNGCVISACDTVKFICILGTIGDYVWMDMDKDGIQDAGEPAVSGVILELYKSTDLTAVLQRDTTDSNGKYEFRGLVAGDYIVKAVSSSFPLGKVVSPKDVGNDSTDSDFDPMTHQSQVIPLDPMNASINPLLKDNPTIDLGLYAPFVCPPKVCTPVTVRKIK